MKNFFKKLFESNPDSEDGWVTIENGIMQGPRRIVAARRFKDGTVSLVTDKGLMPLNHFWWITFVTKHPDE